MLCLVVVDLDHDIALLEDSPLLRANSSAPLHHLNIVPVKLQNIGGDGQDSRWNGPVDMKENCLSYHDRSPLPAMA